MPIQASAGTAGSLTADAPFAGGRPLGSLSTPPPRGICMQTVCRRCGEALITTGAARAGTLAAQNRQIWPLTPELISRLMTRTKSAGICRRPRTQSATTVLTLCSRAHAPDSRLCEIAVSCPAEIFRAHGQAGIIHYLALGRTVLTNTRGNASAARMGRPLSRHVRCLACGRVPVRRGRQGRLAPMARAPAGGWRCGGAWLPDVGRAAPPGSWSPVPDGFPVALAGEDGRGQVARVPAVLISGSGGAPGSLAAPCQAAAEGSG